MFINFGSGPASLPKEILKEAAEAVINYNNSGLSILEIPHRGKLFEAILDEANELVIKLLDLNESYQPLWIQGGGRLQFSMIPMNFLEEQATAGYIDSGHWAEDAMNTAQFYGKVAVIGSSKSENYTSIPKLNSIPNDLAYLHLTSNNTIYGTQFKEFPSTPIPIMVDMSSELFSRKLDYRQFDLIYAVAQKNIGPAGVTLVIIKKSLFQAQKRKLPGILSYHSIARKNSVLNTPPVFAIYCSLLMLRWIDRIGIENLEMKNQAKAQLLYGAIDQSKIFKGIARKESRSLMNVCFSTQTPEMDQQFIEFAQSNNITGIKGHRNIGGLRVALYNAIDLSEVENLVSVMNRFEESRR